MISAFIRSSCNDCALLVRSESTSQRVRKGAHSSPMLPEVALLGPVLVSGPHRSSVLAHSSPRKRPVPVKNKKAAPGPVAGCHGNTFLGATLPSKGPLVKSTCQHFQDAVARLAGCVNRAAQRVGGNLDIGGTPRCLSAVSDGPRGLHGSGLRGLICQHCPTTARAGDTRSSWWRCRRPCGSTGMRRDSRSCLLGGGVQGRCGGAPGRLA